MPVAVLEFAFNSDWSTRNPLIETLADDFEDGVISAPPWYGPNIGGPYEEDGVLVIDPEPGSDAYIQAGMRFTLLNSEVFVEVPSVLSATSTFDESAHTSLRLLTIGGNSEELRINYAWDEDVLELGGWSVLTTVPYNPTDHRWWKISGNGVNTFFYTSPDGLTWTLQHTGSWVARHESVRILLYGQYESNLSGTPVTLARFDNLNVAPPTEGVATGAYSFSATATGLRTTAGSAVSTLAFSATASGVVTTFPLGTPQNLFANTVSTTQINLSWDSVAGASGYDIERDSVVIVSNHAATTYNDTGLSPGTEYDYRVRAVG